MLVIDTATPDLSLALFDGNQLTGAAHQRVGRGHAEQLLPGIAALSGGGRADAIWVGCGPGSFTGIRIGIAAAKALAFAWQVPLRGFDTMALIAASARSMHGFASDMPLGVAVEGGHGDWFVSDDGSPARSMPPRDAARWMETDMVAGSRASDLVALRGHGSPLGGDADARCALQLSTAAFLPVATPIYGRAPDAVVAS